MKQLEICNLRRITHLTFVFPEKSGVYLLTGANGAGKSTMLSCLAQLGDPNALNHFFQESMRFCDNANAGKIFDRALVRFTAPDGTTAEYRHQDGAWHGNADAEKAIAAFGYAGTVFTGAKPKRLTDQSEQFSVKDIKPADDWICKALCEIFDEEKFLELCTIRKKDTGEEIFLRKDRIDGADYYFSENGFSAGERAILKLTQELKRLGRHSLVLIDEAEMALHPKAQKRLLEYLKVYAAHEDTTVIISTQSASLIKIANPKALLFLEREQDGTFICRDDVYPAAILGEMAFAEEILPEVILLVEDQEASMLLEAIVSKLKSAMPIDFPYCKILPVGGYMQVIILLDNLSKVFPPYVKRRAVLDKDAERNVMLAGHNPGRAHSDVVSRNLKHIFFLPCAPEQGVIQLLESNPQLHSDGLKEIFGGQPVNLFDVMRGDFRYREIPGDSRSDCKEKLTLITAYLSSLTGAPHLFVRQKLYRYYIDNKYYNIKRLKQEYCPLIFQN